MKKLTSLLLTTVMAGSVLAACAPAPTDNTTAAGTTAAGTTAAGTTAAGTTAPATSDLAAEISVSADKDWIPYYEAAIKRVTAKYPKSKITIKDVGAFDVFTVIDSTDATNPDVPDVFAIPADRMYGLNGKNALAKIDAKKIADEIGGFVDYDKNFGGNLKIGNDYFAIPMNIETLAVFTNNTNAKAASIDVTKPVDFKDAKDLQIMIPAHDAWFGVSLANSAGLNLLGKTADGKLESDMTKDWADLGADKQAVINTLYEYWKVIDAQAPEIWDRDKAGSYIDEQFKDGGKAVWRIDGPWAIANLQKLSPDLGLAPLSNITVNGKPLRHWQGGWGLSINARNEENADKMLLSTELIKEILNPEYFEDFFSATGKIMLNVPAEKYAASTKLTDIQKNVIGAIIESFKNAEARPLFDEWGQVWPSWQNALLSWSSIKPATVEDAYKALQDSFKTMMGNFGQ